MTTIDKNRERSRLWRLNNPEKALATKRAWIDKNRDKIKLKRKEWRKNNRVKCNEEFKRWKERHPDKYRARKKLEYAKHGKKMIASQKRFYQTHPEANKARVERIKQWALENPEKTRANTEKYRRTHRTEIAERAKKYAALNPEKVSVQRATAFAKRRARLANATFDESAKGFYSWVRSQEFVSCTYCGQFIEGMKAHIDHIVALAKGGHHAASNLCTSCKSCNAKKHTMSVEEFRMRNNLISKEGK